jgi:hypothetical protein
MILSEHKGSGKAFIALASNLDSMLLAYYSVENGLIINQYINFVVQQSLQTVWGIVETVQHNIFPCGKVQVITASRRQGYPEPGQIGLTLNGEAILFLTRAGTKHDCRNHGKKSKVSYDHVNECDFRKVTKMTQIGNVPIVLFADVGDDAKVELAAGQVVWYGKLGV